MKKIFSLLAVLTVTVFMATSAFADINIVKSAFASFSEVAMVFNVDLYEWVSGKDFTTYTGTGAESIAFDVSGITLGNATPQWAGGTVFAKISSNLSIQQSGTTVYMFTKNTTATGDYKANAGRTDGDNTLYGGLVKKGNTTTYQDGDLAPLFVKCQKISDANASYKSALPANFSEEELYDGSRIVADYSDSNFATLQDFMRVVGTSGVNGGLWVGYGNDPATNWFVNEDVIMFFGATFDHVTAGSEYGTTTINFVQSVE
jgi:hypothetical protein